MAVFVSRNESSDRLLGRHWDNDVVIKDPTVSRRHALIMETRRGFVLRDLDSANGTFVNDVNIGAVEHVLRSGSRIRLGAIEVTLFFTPEVAGYPIPWNYPRAVQPAGAAVP